MQAVVLPVLGANMSHGVVRAWFKREGERVEVGDRLFEVETDKANAEVEAEVAGVLRRIVAPPGTRVPILGLVAFIGGEDEPVPPPETWPSLVPRAPEMVDLPPGAAAPERLPASGERAVEGRAAESRPAGGAPPGAPRAAASPAARRLARELGVSIEAIRGTGPRGEVTRADVEAAARGGAPAGRLDPAFLDRLRRDLNAFRALSSEMKVHLYRQHGARIGEDVRIEPGAAIVAEEIVIGSGSVIGPDSIIECETLRLGRLVAFGRRTRVHCRSLEIGDALWSKDDVVIGGGGSGEPGARLRAGDACFFGEGAYLNPCHPVTLGDEVCIGSRAMLFTHSHWQSVLRGYSAVFAPVEIGDGVFIGNNAFVFPGVSIGAGATVVVNSMVAHNVPPATLVAGVPAQVIRRIVPPTRDEQIEIAFRLMPELGEVLRQRGYAVSFGGEKRVERIEVVGKGGVWFVPRWTSEAVRGMEPRAVVLTFADDRVGQIREGLTVFDLAASQVIGEQDELSDEVREFCRRRGIRFRPYAWRYGVGHFEGERFQRRG